jgi:hypothetical protein
MASTVSVGSRALTMRPSRHFGPWCWRAKTRALYERRMSNSPALKASTATSSSA